jgi:hypothetical protein
MNFIPAHWWLKHKKLSIFIDQTLSVWNFIFFPWRPEKCGWIREFKAHFNSISKSVLRFWGLYFNLLMLKKMFIHTARNISIYHSIVCLIFTAAQHQVKNWKTWPITWIHLEKFTLPHMMNVQHVPSICFRWLSFLI